MPPAAKPNQPPGRHTFHFSEWMLAALLLLATLALYWPALHCGFINFDDPAYVTQNLHVRNGLSWKSLAWAFCHPVVSNWHPLTMLSHMLDCQCYGLNPVGHHLTNILLHALNGVLVFVLLRQTTGARWRSALVAALFAVHPLRVESVAWIAERKDVLSGCFGLLTLIFYARYAQKRTWMDTIPASETRSKVGAPARARRGGWGDYGLALVLFALGLMSKPMLVTWPFVMLLLDFWPLVRFKAGQAGRLFVEKIPFFALSAGASVVTFVIQRSSGAMESGEKFAFGARLANALISYCRYLGKVFWPTDLALPYPYPGHWPLEQELLAGGLMAGLSVALLLGRQRFPFSLMGWLWFCGTLVPVIGLVQVGSQAMADRYTYLPSIGLFVMLVWGGRELVRRSGIVAVALSSAAVAAVLLAGELTHQQLAYWRDSVTLFTRTLAVTKDNYAAHNNLGTALDDNGMPAAAIREFQEARRLEPDDVAAYNNLGAAFTLKGEVDAAIDQYRQALLVQPDNATARANLGNALYGKGEIDAAMNQFQELLRRHPEHAQAHFNLGVILGQKGQLDQAISQLEEAFRLRPDYAEAHFNLALALAQKGLTSAAIAQYEEALRIKPDYAEAHNNLGSALGRMGLLDGAISEFREAVRLQPGYDQARENLAQALSVRNSPADH